MNDHLYEIHKGKNPSDILCRNYKSQTKTTNKQNNTMSAIIAFKVTKEEIAAIPDSKCYKGKKGHYIDLTAFVNDELKFENNVSIQLSQSKEEREEKAPKTFLGNGKVLFVRDGIKTAKELEGSSSGGDDWDD